MSRRGSSARRSITIRADWAERVNRSGHAYVTPAVLDEPWMVRVSVGAELTERDHVAAGWTAIRQAAEAE